MIGRNFAFHLTCLFTFSLMSLSGCLGGSKDLKVSLGLRTEKDRDKGKGGHNHQPDKGGGRGDENDPGDSHKCHRPRILIGGHTTSDNLNDWGGLVAIKEDGSLDPSFNKHGTGIGGLYGAMIWTFEPDLSADGIETAPNYIGGMFDTYDGKKVSSGLIKVDRCGNLDRAFNSDGIGFESPGDYLGNLPVVYEVTPERDIAGAVTRKIWVGGIFTTYNGVDVPNYLVRLNSADGSLDSSFNVGGTGFNERVYFIVQELGVDGLPTGFFLIGGCFTRYNGIAVPMIVRMNSAGEIDPSFEVNLSNPPTSLNQELSSEGLPTGKLIVGGSYSPHILRLNRDGSVDTTFGQGVGFDGETYIVMNELGRDGLPTGKLLVAGNFSQYDGVSIGRNLVRLNFNGTLDLTFNNGGSGFDEGVWAMRQERASDGTLTGKLLVGGRFSSYNGRPTSQLVRLNTDGTLDPGFDSDTSHIPRLIRAIW